MEVGRPRGRTPATATATSPIAASLEEAPREMISGRVLATDGSPIAGAVLTLGKEVVRSDADGRFQIPTGSGKLRVMHPGHFRREVEAEGARSMSLVLVPGTMVVGTITGPGGQAVANAEIQFGTSEDPPSALGGRAGEYQSPLLSRGAVCAVVSHAGYQPQSRVLNLREPLETWHVRLASGDKLIIEARDSDGTPLPDAEVWISASGSDSNTSAWRFMGRTDDLGQLETRKEPGVGASLRIRLAGHRDLICAVEPEGGQITARLRKVPALRAQAIDSLSGLPVRIASLHLEVLSGGNFVETPHRGLLFQALETGKLIVGLPPQAGTYRVHVRSALSDDKAWELQAESAPIEFDGTTAPEPFVVRLAERIELRGVVQSPTATHDSLDVELLLDAPPESLLGALDDGPERRWLVSGFNVPAPLRKIRKTVTQDGGRFAFEGLSPGTYRIRVDPKEAGAFAQYLSAPFALPWEGEFPVQLRRAAVVAGRSTDHHGAPRAGIPVLLIHQEDWARVTHTDENGRFEFRDVGPGSGYRLVVRSDGDPGSPGNMERRLTVEEGRDVRYDLHPTETEGDTTSLAKGVAREDDQVAAPVKVSARKDLPGLLPGLQTGSASAEDIPGVEELAGAEEPVEDPAQELEPAPPPAPPGPAAIGEKPNNNGSIELRLLDAATNTAFLTEAEISVEELDGRKGWRGRARDGRFGLGGLQNGPHRLRVTARGLLLAERELEVQGSVTTTLELEEPHDVAVKLQQSDGRPFRGRATIVLRDGTREILRRVEEINESLTVPTPGPGEYELTVESEDFESRMRVRVTRDVEAR